MQLQFSTIEFNQMSGITLDLKLTSNEIFMEGLAVIVDLYVVQKINKMIPGNICTLNGVHIYRPHYYFSSDVTIYEERDGRQNGI